MQFPTTTQDQISLIFLDFFFLVFSNMKCAVNIWAPLPWNDQW